jgi:hypothetical protein
VQQRVMPLSVLVFGQLLYQCFVLNFAMPTVCHAVQGHYPQLMCDARIRVIELMDTVLSSAAAAAAVRLRCWLRGHSPQLICDVHPHPALTLLHCLPVIICLLCCAEPLPSADG